MSVPTALRGDLASPLRLTEPTESSVVGPLVDVLVPPLLDPLPTGTGSHRVDIPESVPVSVRWSQRYRPRLIIADVVAVLMAAGCAHFVRFGDLESRLTADGSHIPFITLTVGVLACWMLALNWSGSRDAELVGFGADEFKRVTRASFAVFGTLAIGAFVFGLALPRSYVLVMMPVGLAGLLAGRFVCRRWLHKQRASGQMLADVLAVGTVETVRELIRELRRAPFAGYRVIGACVMPELHANGTGVAHHEIDGVPIVGDFSDVAAVARSTGADAVAVTAHASFGPSAVRQLSWELEQTETQLILAPALTNIAGPRIHTQPIAGLPLIHVDRPAYRGANRILKKTFDVGGSFILLLILSPVLAAIGLAVKLTSTGPAFFRQERAGINGGSFRMIKFRSMVNDAETRLADLTTESRDAGNSVLFKLKDDPRVTRIGKIIRRISVDELPQLLNVLKGDMSLVGPRPPLMAEVESYGNDARRRLLVKPGMTGLWQISGRSDLSWEDTVRLDVYYVENWSIASDLLILWKTAKAVVSSSGAY